MFLSLSNSLGVLHLRLKGIDNITHAVIELTNAVKEAGNVGTRHFQKASGIASKVGDFVANQESENDELYRYVGSLLLRLGVIAKVVGDFAAVRFHLDTSLPVPYGARFKDRAASSCCLDSRFYSI